MILLIDYPCLLRKVLLMYMHGRLSRITIYVELNIRRVM